MGRLSDRGEVLRAEPRLVVAARQKRRVEGSARRQKRANSPSESQSIHGRTGCGHRPSRKVKALRHSDTTLEQARDIRAHVWRYVFDCHARKKGGPTVAAPNDRKGDQGEPVQNIISK